MGAGPTAYAALSLSPYVTPIAERAKISFRQLTTGATAPEYRFRSRGGPAIAGFTNHSFAGAGGSISQDTSAHIELHVDTSQQIDWNREVGASAHNVEVFVIGMLLDLHHD